MEEKKCIDCGADISHKVSKKAVRCQKCIRRNSADGFSDTHKEKIKRQGELLYAKSKTIYLLYDSRCAICGWRVKEKINPNEKGWVSKCYANEIHHIISVSRGGLDDLSNLILLCPNHHKQADYRAISIDELKKYQIKDSEIESTIKTKMDEKEMERLHTKTAENYIVEFYKKLRQEKKIKNEHNSSQ